ncbi:hypothetical protein HRI_001376500 [Hibiscus trionum]|uniref:DUF4408 domain-containing protein n=1 Tax=Hibiscus trionum TaxID=183268 RepID=A0A9W7LTM3_HIBTR|nr:hypothetical protein HRI_001376500 [Hibiscus trionum]
MLEESMSSSAVPSPSLWASIFSWFAPTVFFVFVNLTIGTIFFTSSLASNKPSSVAAGGGGGSEGDERNDPRLIRSPSVFQRLKSINLYSHRSEEPVSFSSRIPDVGADFHFSFQQQTTPEWQQQPSSPPPPCLDGSPSIFQRLKSINLYGYFSPEQKTHGISSHYTPDGECEEIKEPEAVQDKVRGEVEVLMVVKLGFFETYNATVYDCRKLVLRKGSEAELGGGGKGWKEPKAG